MVRRTAEKNFKKGDIVAFPTGDGKTENGKANFPVAKPKKFQYVNMTEGVRGHYPLTDAEIAEGQVEGLIDTEWGKDEILKLRFFWEEERVEAGSASEIIISPNTFPGTYRVVGDALIRSEATGADEAFQFVINKAKMLSEVTLNMQAEGDPSTFSMTLNVLRDNDGNMMSLIKYN